MAPIYAIITAIIAPTKVRDLALISSMLYDHVLEHILVRKAMRRSPASRKQRKTFTLSRQAISYLEAARKEAHTPSTSALLEQMILERQQQRERQKTNAAITRYYDSLTTTEQEENRLWGGFSEEQIGTER